MNVIAWLQQLKQPGRERHRYDLNGDQTYGKLSR